MRGFAAAFLAGIVTLASPAAQDPAQEKPPLIFRAGVDAVQLEVSVLDRERRPIRDLTARDFLVREDGRPQPIIDVQAIHLDRQEREPVWEHAVRSDLATNDIADRRLIAVVMDDLHCCAVPGTQSSAGTNSDRWAIRNAIETAERIVESLSPRDLAVVALTHDPIPVMRFTNNRAELRETIARFAPITESGCLPMRPSTAVQDVTRLLAMSPQPVKAVVLLTSLAPINSRQLPRCALPTYVQPHTGQVVTVFRPIADEGPSPDRLDLSPVPRYTLNVSGLVADSTGVASGRVLPEFSLRDGPTRDGGRNYFLTNRFEEAVREILAENNSYYLVGFRTSRPTVDGAYRRLQVEITRPGTYDVRTRAGYLRPRPAPAPGSAAARNVEIPRPPQTVAKMLPVSDITVTASVAAFAAPAGRVTLITTAALSHNVTQPPVSGEEELEWRTVVYQSGDPKHDVREKTRVRVPPGFNRVAAVITSRLDVLPSRYELWLTARDARTNRLGSVFYDLDVTDYASRSVSLSGILLGTDPAAGEQVPQALEGLVRLVPTVSRSFGTGEEVTAFLQVYQGGQAPLLPVEQRILVLDPNGAVAFEENRLIQPAQFSSARAADVHFRLPLKSLSAGPHLLSMEAHRDGRISPKRDVPFMVR
jgi:hypothetical protein